ncbi:duf21 and cbs domain protein [Phlyctema vagabunda]|uniref:Duf21 and cbs domain protein n=1 Tax=Phlyctema vagabunda TaxID=108571 RepID=A0ABR4PYI0_9HELO
MSPTAITYGNSVDEPAMKLVKDAVRNTIAEANHAFVLYCLNAALSVALVLLGGLFAGLTLAYMGQDRVYLQVVAASGNVKERANAQRVLNVLSRGRHWVLVSLLLGNVIVNETLPIILDSDVKGGWFAVLTSTVLIVIFGEIIPQSICAKHGLAIGAWSSRYVLWVMYMLFPVAYPIARLLDSLLGNNHGIIFNRAGLKALLFLHERLSFSPTDRLSREEVTLMSAVLDMKERPVLSISTPISKLFTLAFNTPLNDMTRYNILNSGFHGIPIHMAGHSKSFIGVLPVRSLVALPAEDNVTIGQLSLNTLPVVRPDVGIQEIVHLFRDRKVRMALVTELGTEHGEPLGIVTARDVMEAIIGDRMSLGML